ncbi:MAG: hypothetical protein JWM20_103 [Patescibacteria group bacterium]|nr:hypothetical protein [Patescibacteria group bacterium]
MKQTILIHGRPDEDEFLNPNIPSPSNAHWFPWIQKQLAMQGEIAQSLEFPFVDYQPDWNGWVSVIENFKIDPETTLVGNSTGGGFILRYLSENPTLAPVKVILVAPWIDPEHELSNGFFDFTIDEKISERTEIHVFVSDDDMEMILKSFDVIKKKFPNATYHEYSGREHFCTPEFPELLEILK